MSTKNNGCAWLGCLVVAAAATFSSFAAADEPAAPVDILSTPPPSGTGLLIAGGIFMGVGGVNLLTAPLCETSAIPANTQTACLGAALGVGITFVVIGLPMLVVGANRRSAYRAWKQAGGVTARLTDLGIAPVPGGGALTWHAEF